MRGNQEQSCTMKHWKIFYRHKRCTKHRQIEIFLLIAPGNSFQVQGLKKALKYASILPNQAYRKDSKISCTRQHLRHRKFHPSQLKSVWSFVFSDIFLLMDANHAKNNRAIPAAINPCNTFLKHLLHHPHHCSCGIPHYASAASCIAGATMQAIKPYYVLSS